MSTYYSYFYYAGHILFINNDYLFQANAQFGNLAGLMELPGAPQYSCLGGLSFSYVTKSQKNSTTRKGQLHMQNQTTKFEADEKGNTTHYIHA